MWCAGSSRRREEQRAVRRRPAGARHRIEEPVAEELELELIEAVLVEDLPQLAKRLGLEQVLEVGVPEPDAPEADAAAACSQRSRLQAERLHSRPKCTSTGPEVVQ